MDLLNIFKLDNSFKRINIQSDKPQIQPNDSCAIKSVPLLTRQTGTDYVKEYVEEENRLALQSAVALNYNDNGQNIDEISVGTAQTDLDKQDLTKIYKQFNFEYRPKETLSINSSMNEIISMIETHSITIIEGVTGCGKSTQVPQFILDNSYKHRKPCNIIVTQPRRIAALSIAERVSRERGWQLGTLIGCQVGMYRNVCNDTRLTYCTTGVLLRKFIKAKNMLEFTHVILDEVHERDQEMDFLLLVIRKLLRTNSRQVKVVLMSATFNVTKFSEYFSVPTASGFVSAPVITIPKKRNFKIHVHYLCQLKSLGVLPEVSISEPFITEKMMTFCIKLINVFDDIDCNSEYDLEDIKDFGGESPRYAVLIFLPGLWEIEQMYNLMNAAEESSKWDIVIMHSSITYDEQVRIFSQPPTGCRRIILSTNITESSITISDIKYVIDFCLTKQLISDPVSNFQCLELIWASKANCDQRAGRAGRIMDGRVYRLVPKEMYEMLPNEATPEILCAPLENLVLQAKLLDMGEPKAILALGIDPPDLSNLENTILLLKETGGLIDKTFDPNRFDGELTDLGRIMANLPIDIRISKLIALGHVFNVLRDTIIMGASMSVKSMFSNPFANRMEAYSAKEHWTDTSTSDCLAFLNAYTVWHKEILINRIKKRTAGERAWAKRNFIEIKVMHEVDFLVGDLTKRLEFLGIKETVGPKKIIVDEVEHSLLLKIVIAGAFYPNYFVRRYMPDAGVGDTLINKSLGGLDPTRTVYLQGWKLDHPGRLYSKRIQEIFKDVVPSYDQAIVEFDGSKRVYVLFSEDKKYDKDNKAKVSSKISPSVYKALKMKQLKKEISIRVLDLRSAKQMADKLKISKNVCSVFFNKDNYEAIQNTLPKTLPILPGLDDSVIPIRIVYFVSPNKFWVHINDDCTKEKLAKIQYFLNDSKNTILNPIKFKPKIGSLVALKWENKQFHRVVVESYYQLKNEDIANVLYIDFGYRECAILDDLREIDNNHEIFSIKALALECRLAGIEPSKKYDSKDFWSKKACDLFKKCIQESCNIYGIIYSIVNSIISLKLEIIKKNNPNRSISLNDLLVEEDLAIHAEENYLSKYNHKLREEIVEYNAEHKEYLRYLQYDKNYLIRSYPDPPAHSECHSEMILKGPYSPLEMTLSSLAVVSSSRKVIINNMSVNSVLLDSNPESPHECLLVASTVKQNPSGTCLSLRNTTLMPNIPGLSSLICLIFAPKIELRRNSSGTHNIGALCGLGCDDENNSLLPEHDLEVYFDTEISIKDMLNINRLRHWINMGICVKSDLIDDLDNQALQCQYKVYELLKTLIDRPVKLQTPNRIINFTKWKLYNDSLFLYPRKEVIKADSIYPLHCALQLEDRDEEAEDLVIHLSELRSLASSDIKLQENIEIHCKLCDIEIYGREALRSHLFMDDHKNREKSLNVEIF